MTPDERRAYIRRAVRDVRTRASVILLKRRALETGEAYARGNGSEAELAGLLVREACTSDRYVLLRGPRSPPASPHRRKGVGL
jgi:hypothetical protein